MSAEWGTRRPPPRGRTPSIMLIDERIVRASHSAAAAMREFERTMARVASTITRTFAPVLAARAAVERDARARRAHARRTGALPRRAGRRPLARHRGPR